MLTEFIKTSVPAESQSWLQAMPGVEVCRFSLSDLSQPFPVNIPLKLLPMHFEALFCLSGVMVLRRQQDELINVEGRDIMLLSDCSGLSSAQLASGMSGILVSVDAKNAVSSLEAMSRMLGNMKLSTLDLRLRMAQCEGCALLRVTPWSRSVFSALDSMPSDHQGSYCVLKCLELLYLLCSESPLLAEDNQFSPPGGYLSRTVTDMRIYMESHLEEKLTIDDMSRKFNISPTAFKSCFKSLYGIPVHRWLQNQRMKRASELLRTTPLAVLQVAQSVGYEGLSQFNVIFKRQFGMTPRQYKKMSEPI